MKAAEAKDEVSGEGDVESGEVGDVEVGEPAAFADWGRNDTVGGGADGRVGVSVLVAVDALGHLLVLVLVEFGDLWWLVVDVGGSEQLLVVGGWCW